MCFPSPHFITFKLLHKYVRLNSIYYLTVLDYELHKKGITLCLVLGDLFFPNSTLRYWDFAYS